MTHTFEKVLAGADALLKGRGAAGMGADDFESAMMDYAAEHRREGESGAVAFSRLVEERDATVTKLWAACDAARFHEMHKRALDPRPADVVKVAEQMVDEFVRARQQPDETEADAFARLLKENDERFLRMLGHAQEARDLL